MRTVIARSALAPTARSPIAQVTVSPSAPQPAAASNVVPAGTVSVIRTPVAGDGPPLVTFRV